MDKPLIGIMINSDGNILDIKRYIKYNKTEGRVFVFRPIDINWTTKIIIGNYWYNEEWNVGEFPFPDAVYNRCFMNKPSLSDKIGKVIGEDKIFNHSNRLNKWRIYTALENTQVMPLLPKTYLYSKTDFIDILNVHDCVFLKPQLGLKGRGVYRVIQESGKKRKIYFNNFTSYEEFDNDLDFINRISGFIGKDHYIIQQGIPFLFLDKRSFDIRTMVQKNSEGKWEISGILSRLSYQDYFITNYYYKISPTEEVLDTAKLNSSKILEKVFKSSLDAAEALEKEFGLLGEISVDFGVDRNEKLWIIEVNGNPYNLLFIELGDRRMIRKVFSRPLEYAYYLTQRK